MSFLIFEHVYFKIAEMKLLILALFLLICVKEVCSGAFPLGFSSTGSTQKQSEVLDGPV